MLLNFGYLLRIVFIVLAFLFVMPQPCYAIKIGLQTEVNKTYIGASTQAEIIDCNTNKLIYVMEKMQGYEFKPYKGVIAIKVDGQFMKINSDKIVIKPSDDGFISVKRKWYRGHFKLVNKGNMLTVINDLPLEEYIQGVDRNYPFKGNIVLLDDPSREINTFTTNIKIPFENGTYLADFSIDDKNYAFTFKVRNGVYQEKWFTRSSGGTLSINGVEYYGGGGIGQYMSSLSYSTEPVEGDYFNDFDMIYEDNGEKIVYEYRNGNEVHFNDTVIYITEPIRHERYAILYKDAQNVMEDYKMIGNWDSYLVVDKWIQSLLAYVAKNRF